MSFNRLMYDKCETKKYLSESRGPGYIITIHHYYVEIVFKIIQQ